MNPKFMFTLIQIVSLISFSFTVADEPRCSKYDFEEKVLEKLVRIEFQFERFKLEFNEAVADMKAAKVDNAQYKETVDEILDRLKETLSDNALERRLNDTLEDKIRELNTSLSTSSPPVVMFKARTLQATSIAQNQAFVFTTVDHDTGKNYNPSNGEFIVPVSGTYMFGVTVCIHAGGCVIGILVDERKVLVEYVRNQSSAPCFSYSTVESLDEGRRVYVKTLPGDGTCSINQSDAYRWNSFYGVLIAN